MSEYTRYLVIIIIGAGLLFCAIFLIGFTFNLVDTSFGPILSVAIALSPIWLPIVLFFLFFEMWMWFVQEKWKFNNGRTTLRIKLPQEVMKSPEAMESVLAQIHNVSTPDNFMQTYIDGKHPLRFSLELVSIGGEVRFYVNVPSKKTKNAVETQLYAQYPGIEITEEIVDYTAEVKWDPDVWEMMSFHFVKKEDEVLPIKTYIDFGMDKLPKEELKFEPMSAMIEYLSTAKPHERVWIQFLIVPHVKKTFKNGHLQSSPTWETGAANKIDEIMKRNQTKPTEEETENRPILTTGERDTIAAIERNTSKYAYETAIRAIYITRPGEIDGDMISPLIRTFSQYDILGRNGIGVRWRTDFDYNFISDFSGRRKLNMKKWELEYYKSRFYLYSDKKGGGDKEKCCSVEELATMFHIPGSAVVTPTLSRVESLRKEAPSNLPVATDGEYG